MTIGNRTSRGVKKLDKLPRWLRPWVLTFLFGRAVRFVSTAGIQFVILEEGKAVLTLANHHKVRNHIGTVHASAMGLLAETATGAVFSMAVPDHCTALMKSMRIDFRRRAEGRLLAEATLDANARQRISQEDKGELVVPVHVTDQSGETPAECEMVWAWRPKSSR